MKRKAAQPVLAPVYVRPTFDAREQAAMRAFRAAAYSGQRGRPKPGDFDPLHLRMGMRMNCIHNRAGWVVSNPLHDQLLCRHPHLDESLPGPGWLHMLYRGWTVNDLVLLASSRAAIDARCAAQHAAEDALIARSTSPTHHAAPAAAQSDLFA